MRLAQQTRQGRARATAVPPAEVGKLAKQGKKLIIVEKDFDKRYVPRGYTKLVLETPVDQFIGLVPAQTIVYLDEKRLGGCSIKDGLDALSELYDELEEANDVLGDDNRINCGGADLAVTVIRNYRTLGANSLLVGQSEENAGEEVSEADYDKEELGRLCLGDPYVVERMKAIAALTTGKNVDEIKKAKLADVLGFRGQDRVVERISDKEFKRITRFEYIPRGDKNTKHMRCLGDSHYFLKDEYKDDPKYDYDLRTMTKTSRTVTPETIRKIAALEGEIHTHQERHADGGLTPHDANRTRVYMNMAYGAKLNVSPNITEDGKKR